ncbi:MAG: arginine--tRNA ligase [bacterium]
MYYETLRELDEILKNTVRELSDGQELAVDLQISSTKDPQHGDLTTNAAMLLAKPLKKAPRDIAARFVERLSGSPLVASAEMAGPGFVNMKLSNEVLLQNMRRILEQKERYGTSNKYAGKRALVEFVSANPTGPLHVGHVRGAVVGDTSAELLKAVGYEVTREYYYNDAGVQMQMLGRSVQARYHQLFDEDYPFPENGYKGDYIRYIAAGMKATYGDSLLQEESWKPFTEYAANVLMSVIMDDLRRLRVKFDTTFSEYSLHSSGAVRETLKELAEKDATYESENAVWLKTTRFGDEKDRVLVKSDGEVTYVTPDIAYHRDKYQRGFDLMVNVMGHDHHSQVERVKIALQLFGEDLSRLHYLLNQMVSIQRGGENIKLSTREGQFMTLVEMADELGADVTRYFYAQRSYKAQMIFDWDLAKQQSMDNPVYYLQYVHARACSMEEKGKERGIVVQEPYPYDPAPLSGERERLLLLKLFYYPMVVMDAAERLESQMIPAYLEDLAKTFHTYYQFQRVLDQDDPEGSRSRLHLVLAVRQVVRNGLHLLKVNAPERM